MKKLLISAFSVAHAALAQAAVSVTDFAVDGEGVVTVKYSLDAPAVITADFREGGVSLGGASQWSMAGDVFKEVPAGTGTITWNAANDVPGREFSDLSVELKSWALTDTPDYLVADLMYGSTCRLRYYPSADFIPGGLVTDEAYRMYYLPLRKIRAKGVAWTMGTTDELGRSTSGDETAHQVALDRNYYIGVFELTHAQCAACGVARSGNYNEEYRWRLTPQNRTPWDGFRGTKPPENPSAGSVFGKIGSRTGLLIDFPTEAQWEFAARGGFGEGTWGDGSSIISTTIDDNLNELACCKGNINVMTDTGSLKENGYGLYDMHGNVAEMCLDWYRADITALNGVCNADGDHYIDDMEKTSAPTARVVRGGHYGSNASGCRAARRTNVEPGSYKTEIACRVMTYAALGEEVEPTSAYSARSLSFDTFERLAPSGTTAAAVEIRTFNEVVSSAFSIDTLTPAGLVVIIR